MLLAVAVVACSNALWELWGLLIQQENDKKKGDKKGRNKKASKSKSSQRKNTKKTNVPQGGNDLITKLYATMEKHRDVSVSINFDILFFFFSLSFTKLKLWCMNSMCLIILTSNSWRWCVVQVFFVIRLHSHQAAQNLPPISDPDPPISCDLMDGRDAFLTIAREKHYEFSSLRRAKLSSMALLYELHNQGRDNFVYTCNSCKAHVETRYHCSVCDVSLTSSVIEMELNRILLLPSLQFLVIHNVN